MVDPTKRRTGKNAPQIVYHCPSTTLPIPTPPKRDQPSSGDSSKSDSGQDIGDPDYGFTVAVEERRPYFPNQKDIDDLIRDLGLTKSNAELLTSRLKQWNLLDESMHVTDQRKRHQAFSNFFSWQDGLCFCNNVAGLFEAIGITYNPSEWRLFIDSSSGSLKAVLLHNGNNYPSLPMAHSADHKENYTSVKMLLSALKYDDYGWEPLEASKWCHSWWVFKAVSRNFLISFASGTSVALSQKGLATTEPFWVIFDVFVNLCCHMFLNHFYWLIKKISSINNHNIIFFVLQLEDDILSVLLYQFHFQMVKQKVYSLPESLFNP